MTSFEVGAPLHQNVEELSDLAGMARNGLLHCRRRDDQSDGDIRYWDVSTEQSPVLQGLSNFGRRLFHMRTGHAPACSLVMVNVIDASRSNLGSGGGWHRDSFRAQHKAFVYLTPVRRETQGAFCYLDGSNSVLCRGISIVHRVATGANRYGARAMSVFRLLGSTERPVLLDAGIPFFVNTSLVHRGLPILEGDRVMATQYLFSDVPDWFTDFARVGDATRMR